MKKTTLKTFVGFVTVVLALVATATSASACWWGLYQPEEPKMLRK